VSPLGRGERSSYECYCCKRNIPRPAHEVVVRASWRRSPESICMNCWYDLMQFAQVGLLQQGTLTE
jgi:hypothetical protein